jgi:hypothetical protein
MIEKIPFLHRDKLYYIIVSDDVTFTALHDILDTLIDQGAFIGEPEDPVLYTVVHEEARYTVGVDGIDVMIACS